jgi:hypothetical protein
MNMKYQSILRSLIAGAVVGLGPAIYAQTAPGDFKSEPDKSMAAAHESFVKGDTKKAVAEIDKASFWVKKQADEVGEGSKAGMKAAGDQLHKLGDGIKNGTVKSGDELKKGFAKVDGEIASCWHKTAENSRKAGKDSTEALKKTGDGLESAAKWSGHQLSEGAKTSLEGLKKAGKATSEGAKAGANQVDKWFTGIGDDLEDLRKKL